MLSNPYSKFFGRLLLFLLLLLAVDFLLGNALRLLFFNQKKGQIAQATYSIDSANEDILIFGSSRAVRHYNPRIIADITSLTCYNVGRDGQRIPFYCAVQELALQRKKPKLIILDMNATELTVDPSKFLKLTLLLPYCKNHPELVKYIEEISRFERYKLYSQVYPFNSYLFIMLFNALFEEKIEADDFGFQPLKRTLSEEQAEKLIQKKITADHRNSAINQLIDPKSVAYFNQFLKLASSENIKTLVVISPELDQESKLLKSQIGDICKNYSNVEFIDYSTSVKYHAQNEKFADLFHLNEIGANEFSSELAQYIQKNVRNH